MKRCLRKVEVVDVIEVVLLTAFFYVIGGALCNVF